MLETNQKNEKKSEQIVYEMIRTPSNLSRSRSSYVRRRECGDQRTNEYSNVQVKEGVEMIVKSFWFLFDLL